MRSCGAGVLVVVFALLGGATTDAASAPVAKQARPNVIVVMTDDMRQDDLAAMPNVRRLIAQQGTSFDTSIVTFPVCCPSRATFLTGQYAKNHGVQDNHLPNGGYGKLKGASTLPVWLKKSGYATIHLGKYLNDYGHAKPTEVPPGWTEWHGGIKLAYLGGTMNQNGTVVRLPRTPAAYATDVYTSKTVEIVKRRSKSAQPFFMWVSYYAPHAGEPVENDDPPDIPTPAVAQRHKDRFATAPPRRLPSFDAATPVQSRKPIEAGIIPQIDEAYRQRLEALAAVDEGVAKIIGAIPRAERANTVFIFTSDNGFFLGEHRIEWGKTWPYEEAVRVPLIVRGPGVPKNAHVKSLVANVDVAATILGFARAKPGLAQDGRSLSGFFTNPKQTWNRAYLIESAPNKAGEPFFLGVRTNKYKYIDYAGSNQGELYDLSVDPYELVSLWKSPAHAAVKSQLAAKLEALKACAGASCDITGP